MSIIRLALLFVAATILSQRAQALTLDAYVDDGSVSSTSIMGATKTVHVPSTKAIGGGRSLSATKSGPGTGISRLEIIDSSIGYTQGAHTGFAMISWDGDTDSTTIRPDGLGSIDLTQDEGTAFSIGLLFFDYPSNQPIQLKLRLYDARTPDGSRFSEISIVLDQFYAEPTPFYMTVPFSLFASTGTSTIAGPFGSTFSTTTSVGPAGAVDVTKVGALSLSFRGDLNSRAPDIILAPFITNGKCSSVPDASGRAIDECSVCHEHVDAKKGKDRCGICLAGPSGYSYESNKIHDKCGLCPGEPSYQFPSGIVDKCGTCLNAPAPYTYIDRRDVCGICNGTTKKIENCTMGINGCPLVKPTAKILKFEKDLIQKAAILRSRYQADVRRATVRKCGISFTASNKKVASAFGTISKSAQKIFRQGIEVCSGSCVTVSYGKEVKALMPHFTILEAEAALAARNVKKCFKELGINKDPSGRPGETARTINAVRSGLSTLIRECSKTNVCKQR
ncbi:MAG: hypothetical protein RL518_294 [Pseudomonadota bacterium]